MRGFSLSTNEPMGTSQRAFPGIRMNRLQRRDAMEVRIFTTPT